MSLPLNMSIVRYPPDAVIDVHAHAEAGVSIVLGGSLSEVVGGREEFGEVGDVVVKPAGVIHRNRIAPSGAVLLAVRGELAVRTAGHGWRWIRGRRGGAIGLNAACRILETRQAEAEEAVWGLLEALGQDPRKARPPSSCMRIIRERIEDDPGAHSVAVLAESAGLHPGSLTRSFRRHYGCSVSAYIRQVRVRRAAQLLLNTDDTIGRIAADVGCYDQSHLCRDFNLELGTSPSCYRAALAGSSGS